MRSMLAVAGLLVFAAGIQLANGQVRPHPLDRHIHGTPAEYNGRIVHVCETRPREYCSPDGATCYLESDVYVSDVACPTIRIK